MAPSGQCRTLTASGAWEQVKEDSGLIDSWES